MSQGSSLIATSFVTFCCWIKHHDQKQLIDEFIWAYSSRGRSIAGKCGSIGQGQGAESSGLAAQA